MSGKAQFRSAQGCCICGTKSSSSRFTPSKRFHQHFERCFGPQARTRSGDLCNACVLCIKRWLKQPYVRRELHRFAPVIDSKRGTGPKHMKQITKQRKRREARLNVNQKGQGGNSCNGMANSSEEPRHLCCYPSCHHHNQHYHSLHHQYSSNHQPFSASSSLSSNSTSTNGTENLNLSFITAKENGNTNVCSLNGSISSINSNAPVSSIPRELSFSGSHKLSSQISYQPPANSTRSAVAALQQQQHHQATQLNLDLTENVNHVSGLMVDHLTGNSFRAPDPFQAPPKRMNRYRRQSQLTPVKLPSSEQEVDQLLREIMAQNSEAVNFDCREMHMAFQNRIRLRSRTVATSFPSSGCSSSTGSGSLNSISSFSNSPTNASQSRDGALLSCSYMKEHGEMSASVTVMRSNAPGYELMNSMGSHGAHGCFPIKLDNSMNGNGSLGNQDVALALSLPSQAYS